MKEFLEKLIGRLLLESSGCKVYKLINPNKEDIAEFNAYKKCIEIVNQLAEEYNNGWIPVSKKLPETNESVLCWAKSTARGGDVCFVGSYHKGFWFLQSSANTHSFPGQYKIVAWQQLPAPYQKGE